MSTDPTRPRVVPFGDDAVLVELADLAAVRALDDAIRAAADPLVVDQVAAARTLLLRGPDPAALADLVARVAPRSSGAQTASGELVTLHVTYDGEDLEAVAALTDRTVADVVARHTSALYTVAFGGFMPGFAYLTGLDPALFVPRLASPRPRVPAGSVAIADEFSAVYPAATPGGWRLLGRCDVALFDIDRDPPALLRPGTRVRFVESS